MKKGSCCATAVSLDTQDRDVTGNTHTNSLSMKLENTRYIIVSLGFFFWHFDGMYVHGLDHYVQRIFNDLISVFQIKSRRSRRRSCGKVNLACRRHRLLRKRTLSLCSLSDFERSLSYCPSRFLSTAHLAAEWHSPSISCVLLYQLQTNEKTFSDASLVKTSDYTVMPTDRVNIPFSLHRLKGGGKKKAHLDGSVSPETPWSC